ncbi:MAG: hypothetical protein ACOX1P_17290 [Thermoguttaceae bacterium]
MNESTPDAIQADYARLLEFVATAAGCYLAGVPTESGEQDAKAWAAAFDAGRVSEEEYLAHRIKQLEFVAGRLRQLAAIRRPPLIRWVNDEPHLIVLD